MPHFLLGTVVALGVRVFGLPVLVFFLVTLVIAILWEVFEMLIRLREEKLNVVSDVAMPLLAYVATLWLSAGVGHRELVALLMVTIILYILVNYAAWLARYDRDPDFQD